MSNFQRSMIPMPHAAKQMLNIGRSVADVRGRTLDMIPGARASSASLQREGYNRAVQASQQAGMARAALNQLQRQSDANTMLLRRLVGQGGTFNSGNRQMNISPYVVPSTPGKGGILPTDPAAFGMTDPAGTSVTVTVPAWARARLTGTFIEGVTLVGTGGLAAVGELAKIEFSVFVNGQTVAALNRVPADVASRTLDGEQIVPASIYIGADVEFTAQFDVLITLTAASAGEVFLRLWCGDGDSYDLRVK